MMGCGHDIALIHALMDQELDAVHAARAEEAIAGCAQCTAERDRLLALRAALQALASEDGVSARLRARLAAVVTPHAEARLRRRRDQRWVFACGGAMVGAAACAAMILLVPGLAPERPLTDELVADHVRSLQVGHLTDVATSDQHVVKPWFNGKLDFAPPVIELREKGFPLVGGRLDYVNHRAVAAIVYRRALHTINLFVCPARGGGGSHEQVLSADGYTLRHWQASGLNFWAVSDVNPDDLARFEALVRAG